MISIVQFRVSVMKKTTIRIIILLIISISVSTLGQENIISIDTPIITMTMEKPYFVGIYLKGSGNITIHWGDGKSNKYTVDNDDTKAYTHKYSKYSISSEKTITITGGNITVLRCNSMQLTRLDVSRNTNLTQLDCFANNLTSLDLSKNTKLTDLCCNANQLTSLDVSNNIALRKLSCYYNQISNLDVSRNTALESLSCDRNRLTSLDISNNILLTNLRCDDNQLQAVALDELFRTLPNVNTRASIMIRTNPGEFHCNRSIATDKGWKVYINDFLLVFKENTTFLKNWASHPVPTDKDTISKYNHALNDWVVYFDGDEIRVDDVRNYGRYSRVKNKLPFEIRQSNSQMTIISAPLAGLIDVIEVEDGYLVGFNRGEWGGELYWFSKNGKKRYEISGHQIVQFIERDNKIYAIEGLAHLTMTGGSIIEIEKQKRKWVAKEFLKLDTAPEAIQLDSKGNFIVVTFGTSWSLDKSGKTVINATPGLFSIDREANIETLVEDGILGYYLYPSSMVIQNDVVYIGMRKGVYKYDLATKRDEWLLPE